MKRVCIIILLALVYAYPSWSQDVRYTFQFKEVDFEEALNQISETTGYDFVYVGEVLPKTRISGTWYHIEFFQFLEDFLNREFLTFQILDEHSIVISPIRSLTEPFRIYGRIRDAEGGEFLAGTNVFTDKNQGVISDHYGLYSIEIDPQRDSLLMYSYLGYRALSFSVRTLLEGRKNVVMQPDFSILQEVTITNKTTNKQLKLPSQNILNAGTYRASKAISGDVDVIEYLNVIPGVVKMSEGRTGFSVQGSATDQNLILIDEAPVFNPSHALGFLSVFNQEALNSATFHKTAISSKYGGRLASVVDIRMREGNTNKVAAAASVNPFYSGLTVDGPLFDNKMTFLLSGRFSHMNYLIDGYESKKEFYVPKNIDFYDIHGKINFKLGQNNRVYISTFLNQDQIMPQKNDDEILFYDTKWKNRTFTFRWNTIWSKKIFTNTSFIFSDYEYVKFSEAGSSGQRYEEQSNISNAHGKFELNYHLNKHHSFTTGINFANYEFNPATGYIDVPSDSIRLEYRIPKIKSRELALFIEDNIKIGQRLNLFVGLRYSRFYDIGDGNYEFTYDESGDRIDSIFRAPNKVIRTFDNLEPRLSVDWQVHEKLLLQASWSRTSQYIVRLLNDNPTTPNEYWIPAGQQIKPLTSNIFAASASWFTTDFTTLRAGLFTRLSKNITAFKDGTNIFFTESLLDRQITQGDFQSYGVELSFEKKKSNYRYQISYTFTDASVRFDDINDGERYNAPQNYRHDFNVQGMYYFSERFTVSGNWQWRSGDLITLPTGIGYVSGYPFEIYTERNNFRLSNYHRLDLSANWEALKSPNWTLDISLGIYNLTGQLNPFQVSVSPGAVNPRIEIMALTRITPFLQFNVRFH